MKGTKKTDVTSRPRKGHLGTSRAAWTPTTPARSLSAETGHQRPRAGTAWKEEDGKASWKSEIFKSRTTKKIDSGKCSENHSRAFRPSPYHMIEAKQTNTSDRRGIGLAFFFSLAHLFENSIIIVWLLLFQSDYNWWIDIVLAQLFQKMVYV